MQFRHSPAQPTVMPHTRTPVVAYISMAACVALTLLAISAAFPAAY